MFSNLRCEDVAIWNAMINAHAQNGQDSNALHLFNQLHSTKLIPDKVTYACALRACSRLLNLEDGRLIHSYVISMEMECPTIVTTTLISMYGKCGNLEDAQILFNKLAEREVATWNSMISVLVRYQNEEQALCFFYKMYQEALLPDRATYVSILGALSTEEALVKGKHMHACIASCSFLYDKVVITALFDMYGSCGGMEDAEILFDSMVDRTKVSWNAMLSELVQNKYHERAFALCERMLWEGQLPDKVTYLNMLFASTIGNAFMQGTIIHLHIINSGYESKVAVGTAIVAMYGKFGNLDYAERVFDRMTERNILSWNSMLKAYADQAHGKKVFNLLHQMQQEGLLPNNITFITSLLVCSGVADLVIGKQLHICISSSDNTELEPTLSNALINMYSKCDSLHDALNISEITPYKDISSWNSLIEAFVQLGDKSKAFQLLLQMQHEGIMPNKVTFINILEVCDSSMDHNKCLEIHASILQGDLKQDLTVASALIKCFGACGDCIQASKIFNMVDGRDVILWNTMLGVYCDLGLSTLSFQVFQQMHQEGELPTSVTYVSLFSACAHSRTLMEGKRFHSSIKCSMFEFDVSLINSLISMYGKCGQCDVSERLFFDMPQRSPASWSAMIAIYAELEHSENALELFHSMIEQGKVQPERITLLCLLSACTSSALFHEGREIHTLSVTLGLDGDTEVANSLINMYGKCGDLEAAWALFLNHSTKNICSWNIMFGLLLGYGLDVDALQLFKKMHVEGIIPCEFSYVTFLWACGNSASLMTGRLVHYSIVYNHVEPTITMGNLIISMYGKCGSLDDALWQFKRLSVVNHVSWNAMLASLAQYGCGVEALQLLEYIYRARSSLDQVSFLTAIAACSHTGLVDAGWNLWISMCNDFEMMPGSKHYACLVDVFSRAGRIADAKKLIANIPCQPCLASWMALLSACKDHAIDDQAFEVARFLIEMDSNESSTYVILSNIHAIDTNTNPFST
ncbi:hypothetical protein KP509_02G028300 [Ceratopteris richardii]|nr:hypothetical protein KP509_02G028300 [Ceratopteris richardii]